MFSARRASRTWDSIYFSGHVITNQNSKSEYRNSKQTATQTGPKSGETPKPRIQVKLVWSFVFLASFEIGIPDFKLRVHCFYSVAPFAPLREIIYFPNPEFSPAKPVLSCVKGTPSSQSRSRRSLTLGNRLA